MWNLRSSSCVGAKPEPFLKSQGGICLQHRESDGPTSTRRFLDQTFDQLGPMEAQRAPERTAASPEPPPRPGGPGRTTSDDAKRAGHSSLGSSDGATSLSPKCERDRPCTHAWRAVRPMEPRSEFRLFGSAWGLKPKAGIAAAGDRPSTSKGVVPGLCAGKF